MSNLIFVGIGVVFFLGLFLYLAIFVGFDGVDFGGKDDANRVHVRPKGYRARPVVMNASEQALYFEIRKQLPAEYHLFPNMRIADFIDARHGVGFYHRRNKILPKHVDFLVCDRSFKPVVAIELNGSSHQRADRIERDALVADIFSQAELAFEVIQVGTDFRTQVTTILGKHWAPQRQIVEAL